ncbi:hypothetical protein TPA0910_22060 [Streptomyces hygroscopicus subsp. sporocinereus]|uniref:Uncharacterized protein n=1 Tax=Streptomyces hygroscopicus TaxID=1912 RepID=A0ABQ3TXR8_STRHY|nr:hypothetical protein TPA0910_22060 [Streptomyces hygroscopicus]
MRERIARSMRPWLRRLFPATGRHRTVDTSRFAPAPAAVPLPAPACVPVCNADTPTLQLPRIAAGERFPIAWDTDPVPLYVLRHERQRASGISR